MRTAAKRDAAEGPIVSALEGVGCHVLKFNDADICDLGVFYRGRCTLMEVKTDRAKLRPGQERFIADMERHGVKVHVVRTPAEALEAIGFTWRKERA